MVWPFLKLFKNRPLCGSRHCISDIPFPPVTLSAGDRSEDGDQSPEQEDPNVEDVSRSVLGDPEIHQTPDWEIVFEGDPGRLNERRFVRLLT